MRPFKGPWQVDGRPETRLSCQIKLHLSGAGHITPSQRLLAVIDFHAGKANPLKTVYQKGVTSLGKHLLLFQLCDRSIIDSIRRALVEPPATLAVRAAPEVDCSCLCWIANQTIDDCARAEASLNERESTKFHLNLQVL